MHPLAGIHFNITRLGIARVTSTGSLPDKTRANNPPPAPTALLHRLLKHIVFERYMAKFSPRRLTLYCMLHGPGQVQPRHVKQPTQCTRSLRCHAVVLEWSMAAHGLSFRR